MDPRVLTAGDGVELDCRWHRETSQGNQTVLKLEHGNRYTSPILSH